VLEIGCGDGRLTWRYAADAAHVTAIDPYERSIARARQNTPPALHGRVDFQHIPLEEFANANHASYDVALLSWSLC
jgi:2-polyprenyl-3-methyl-5-hydroxy-6-metoxy-1,4-benzoquinol methylase